MLNKLTIAVFGVLALASFRALALDLPDIGSKNFSPAGETPTYFANETVPVSARTADTSAADWTAEEAAAPLPSVARQSDWAHPNTGRRGKYASSRRTGSHAVGKSAGHGHSMRFVSVNAGHSARSASAHRSIPQARMASKRPASAERALKTSTAKHGKAGARHANLVVTHPAVADGTEAFHIEAS